MKTDPMDQKVGSASADSDTTALKPVTVYGHWAGPNPYKVHIILTELKVPFTYQEIEFDECKKEPFLSINPNGRLPAIEDPNTGTVLWESGAIVNYLIDEYDRGGMLTYSNTPEKWQIQQWLFFQASGQGPYYGQAVWFAAFHPEKFQSAIDRYIREIERVRSVLNRHLQDGEWLVGDKCTIADLSWVMWENVAELLLETQNVKFETQYPNYEQWFARLKKRSSVNTAIEMRANGIKKHRLLEMGRKD